MGDGRTFLSPVVAGGGIWRVRMTWPNGTVLVDHLEVNLTEFVFFHCAVFTKPDRSVGTKKPYPPIFSIMMRLAWLKQIDLRPDDDDVPPNS